MTLMDQTITSGNVVVEHEYSVQDLEALEDGAYEFMHGELIRKTMGLREGIILGKLTTDITVWNRSNGSTFHVIPESYIKCFPDDPRGLRKPDLMLVKRDRVPAEIITASLEIAPDLAIEILSPTDNFRESERKLDDYERAGVRMVWHVIADRKRVRVFDFEKHSIYEFIGDQTIELPDLLPGLSVPVKSIFENV